jgi:type IV pilus assembly protein PilA
MVLAFVAEAGEEGALYIASSSEYLAQVRGGKLPTLSSNPEFAKALATLPKEGNCLTYISPAYYQLSFAPMIQQFEQTPTPASPAILHMLRDYLAKFDQPQTTVTFLTPDGMKSIGYSDQAIEDVLVAFPAGIMAAMAIPAFEKVRATSEEKAVTNNLRMIAAAADQYFLETGETEVHISQLVGPGKYIEQLELVAGESYDDLTIYQGYEVISVTLEDGRTVNYGPAGSWVTPAGSESEDWESEAPSEDWSEEDTEDWNDEEWSEESEDSYEEE